MKKAIALLLVSYPILLAGSAPAYADSRICSGLTPQNWRMVVTVPPTWDKEDCRAFVASIGAKDVQLGCLFDQKPTPTLPKFSWGVPSAPVTTQPTTAGTPTYNCGWPWN